MSLKVKKDSNFVDVKSQQNMKIGKNQGEKLCLDIKYKYLVLKRGFETILSDFASLGWKNPHHVQE